MSNDDALEVLVTVRRLASSGEAREIRKMAEVPLASVADACGVTPSCVHHWETGARQVSRAKAFLYAEALATMATVS